MKPAMWRTFWLMWFLFLAWGGSLVAYDVWTAWHDGTESTISWVFYDTCKAYPGLAWATGAFVGLLFGHLLFSQHRVGCSPYEPIAEMAVRAIRYISLCDDIKTAHDAARPVVIAALNIDTERHG